MCMYYKSVLINFFTGLTCKLNFAVFFMRCPIFLAECKQCKESVGASLSPGVGGHDQ